MILISPNYRLKDNMINCLLQPLVSIQRCIKYDFSEERTTSDGVHIKGRYVDFNGEVFGEVPFDTGILNFRGSKAINSLDVLLR